MKRRPGHPKTTDCTGRNCCNKIPDMQTCRGTLTLLVFLGLLQAKLAGQELKETPSPDASVFLQAPLDEAFRSKIEQALKGKDYGRVEALLIEEIKGNPKSALLLTVLGHTLFLDGKYLDSAVAMKKAERLSPLNESDRFTLAMAYVRLNHNDWARPELVKLTQTNPGKALYLYWLGRLDYSAQQFRSAVTRFHQTLNLDPNFVKAYDNLGLCHEALGEYDEAIRAYQDANRLNRQNTHPSPWPPLNLGSLLVKLDHLSEAEPCLRESLTYDGKFSKAHYQLGMLLEKQRKHAEAIEELKLAADLDSSYAEPHYALSRIYRKQGDIRNAEVSLSAFQKLKHSKAPKAPAENENALAKEATK